MPPADDPLCRLQGRAAFEEALRKFWLSKNPPVSLKWPRFDRHYLGKFLFLLSSSQHNIFPLSYLLLDSYYMYEVLNAMGGLNIVSSLKNIFFLSLNILF